MDSYYQKAKRSNQRHLRGIREHHNRRHSPERPASTKPDGNDYVRRWLSQTQRKPDWESHVQSKHTHQPRDDLSSWRPHNLGAVDLERLARPTGGRKRRGRSPDSSIIPINPKRRDATGPTEQVSGTRDGGHHHYDEPNQWPEFHSQSPLPSTEEGGNAKFERRARHKTRPDRYNTNKEKQPRLKKESNVAEEKAKRTKDVSSKKRKLSSGRDVMKTYDSDALLTKDRLTVPTHMTPGIFANARVAQPDHVADLAYNEMDFLRHPARRETMPPPKTMYYRQKDQSRRARERQELSSFFATKNRVHAPAQNSSAPGDANDNHLDDRSVWVPTESSAYSQAHGYQRKSTEVPSIVPDSNDVPWSCSPRAHIYRSKQCRPPELPQISWPPTNHSPNSRQTENYFERDDNSISSSPPEHVRAALGETGVFDCFRERRQVHHAHADSEKHRRDGRSKLHRKNLHSVHPNGESEGRYKDRATMVTPEVEEVVAPLGRGNQNTAATQTNPIAEIERLAPKPREEEGRVEDKSKVKGQDSNHPCLPRQQNTVAVQRAQEPVDRRQQAAKARVPVYTHRGSQAVVIETQQAHDMAHGDAHTLEQASHSWTEVGNDLSTYLPQGATGGERNEVYQMSNPVLQEEEEYGPAALQDNCDGTRAVDSRARPFPGPYHFRIPSAASQTMSASTDAYSWLPRRPQSISRSIPEFPESFARPKEMGESRPVGLWTVGRELPVDDDSKSLDEYIRRAEQDVFGKETSSNTPVFGSSRNPTSSGAQQTEGPAFRPLRRHDNIRVMPSDLSARPGCRDARQVRFEIPAAQNDPVFRYDFENASCPAEAYEAMRRSHVDFIDGNRTTATAPEPEAEIWDQYPWQEARPTNDEVDERAEMANFWGQSRLQQF